MDTTKIPTSSAFDFSVPGQDKIRVPSFDTPLFSHFNGNLNAFTPPVTPVVGQDALAHVPDHHVAAVPTVETPFARPSSFTVRDRDVLKRVEGSVDSLVNSSAESTATMKRVEGNVTSLGDSTLELATSIKDLATSSKTIAMHIHGVGEHVKQFDPVFIHLAEGQAKHGTLIKQITTTIESLDEKVDSVQATLDALVLQVETLTERKTTETNETAIALRKEIQELAGTIDLAFIKACRTLLQETTEDEGFESELENEENPLRQVLFPQGNGRFENGAIETGRGAGGERFEKGIVRAGRGGGNGGGWCAVM